MSSEPPTQADRDDRGTDTGPDADTDTAADTAAPDATPEDVDPAFEIDLEPDEQGLAGSGEEPSG